MTTGQVLLMSAGYLGLGSLCLFFAWRGTKSWRTNRDRVLGAIAGGFGALYGLYLLVIAIMGGLVPFGWLGLVLPGGMALNAVRHNILRR